MVRNLAEGEKIRVSTGCLVAFEDSVDYDIESLPGFKNMIFGGEGVFMASMTGMWLNEIMHIRTEISIYLPTYLYRHTYIHAYIHMHTYMRIYTHTFTRTY